MNPIDNSLVEDLGLNVPKTERSKELGQNDFMELMIAQMQNQDPFQPMENGEFLVQMAQFSTVSGIQEMQGSLEQLAESLYSNQALQASSLVGRTVLAPANQAQLPEEGAVQGSVELPSSTDKLVVGVYNLAGDLVKRIDLGVQPGGTAEFTWDGSAEDGSRMPPGNYRIQAEAQFDGDMLALDSAVRKEVSSVTLGGAAGGLVLTLSDGSTLDFSDVRQIM